MFDVSFSFEVYLHDTEVGRHAKNGHEHADYSHPNCLFSEVVDVLEAEISDDIFS
jgi:hypothetical protein